MRIDGWGSRTAPYGLRCTVHRQMAVKLREGEGEGVGRERKRERRGDKSSRNFSTIKLSNLPMRIHVHSQCFMH